MHFSHPIIVCSFVKILSQNTIKINITLVVHNMCVPCRRICARPDLSTNVLLRVLIDLSYNTASLYTVYPSSFSQYNDETNDESKILYRIFIQNTCYMASSPCLVA
jgi:hypothetical protein